MVIESLSHQHLGQFALLAGAFLDLGALVLEPDLDLVFVQVQLESKVLSSFFGEVPVVLKLSL